MYVEIRDRPVCIGDHRGSEFRNGMGTRAVHISWIRIRKKAFLLDPILQRTSRLQWRLASCSQLKYLSDELLRLIARLNVIQPNQNILFCQDLGVKNQFI